MVGRVLALGPQLLAQTLLLSGFPALIEWPEPGGVFRWLGHLGLESVLAARYNARLQGLHGRIFQPIFFALLDFGGRPAVRPGCFQSCLAGKCQRVIDRVIALSVNWQTAVEQTVAGLGYELVDTERGLNGLLRVYIDCLPGSQQEFIIVEDCEKVTRQLQHVLEVEGCAYERLEVSSPGLDRPLKKAADYARFAGQEIDLQLKEPFAGRKKFRGVLLAQAVDGVQAGDAPGLPDQWQLVFQDGKVSQVLGFTIQEVREAKLVPVVDFKGRRFAAPPADSNNEDKEDGDRDE